MRHVRPWPVHGLTDSVQKSKLEYARASFASPSPPSSSTSAGPSPRRRRVPIRIVEPASEHQTTKGHAADAETRPTTETTQESTIPAALSKPDITNFRRTSKQSHRRQLLLLSHLLLSRKQRKREKVLEQVESEEVYSAQMDETRSSLRTTGLQLRHLFLSHHRRQSTRSSSLLKARRGRVPQRILSTSPRTAGQCHQQCQCSSLIRRGRQISLLRSDGN